MNIFKALIIVGIGSGVGGMMRYLVARLMQGAWQTTIPLGTLIANVLGCLIIGALYGAFERGNIMSAEMRLLLTVGLCGGFTTFSTFMNENYSLMQVGDFVTMAIYAAVSLLLGLLAVYGGHALVRVLW